MESLSQKKIELYVDRTFGERFNAAMDFVKIHYRVLLKILACFILPICVIEATFINTIINRVSVINDFGVMDAVYVFLLLLLLILSTIMVFSITFGLYKAYDENPDGSRNMKIKEFLPYLKGCIKKGTRLFFFLLLVYVLEMAIYLSMSLMTFSGLSSGVLLIQYPISFAIIPIVLLPTVYFLENRGIFSSLKRAFSLGYRTYLSLLGIYFIVYIIISFVTVITLIPYVICIVVDILSLTRYEETKSWELVCANFGMYLFGILFIFVYHFIAIISSYAAIYHYGYAVEHLEHVSVVSDIENFEKMSDNSLDSPKGIIEDKDEIDNFENL
ncbi:MAG: hypothetical protein K6E54_03815 [Bacteroidaceae bacterium]|nr:hypothetical protein [Bacteroidaceae bacterium]